jgi:predicted Zn-dependent protease
VIAVYAGGSAAAVDFRPATGSVPDLVRLSGLLSGNRLEPETGVIPLSAAEVSQASRELTATPFSQLKPRAGVALAWHRAEATRGEALRLWPAAIRHLSALVTAAPGDPELRRRRGNAYAELGRWQEAARDYADALDRGEIRHPEWYRTALTQLAARDTAGYRRTCTRMLDRFERSMEARPRDLTAWTCAFGPSAPLDLARAVRLTQDLLRAEPENHSFRETLGALFLRAGRLREASACLREVIARDDTGGSAATHLFLARCESRLGNREAARQELVRGRERLTRDGAPGLPWDDRLERTLLQREAETAVSP